MNAEPAVAAKPRRPTLRDESVVREAAKKLAPEVRRWLMSTGEDDPDIESVEADLADVLDWHEDGFEIAKELDHNGWSPDAELVEILDSASSYKRDALGKAEAEWVKDTGAKEIPLQTRVTWPLKKDAGVGVVTANSPSGKSTVSFESMGHKPGCGYVVEWEQLVVEPGQ